MNDTEKFQEEEETDHMLLSEMKKQYLQAVHTLAVTVDTWISLSGEDEIPKVVLEALHLYRISCARYLT